MPVTYGHTYVDIRQINCGFVKYRMGSTICALRTAAPLKPGGDAARMRI